MKDTSQLNRYLNLVNMDFARKKNKGPEDSLPCITISRMPGCRGNTIGQLLLSELNKGKNSNLWRLFGRDFGEKIIELNEWPRGFGPYLNTPKLNPLTDAVEESLGLHPPLNILHKNLNRTIFEIGEQGNVILLGRGANFILKGVPKAIHIRLIGTLPFRIHHIQETLSLNFEAAKTYLNKKDAEQKEYIQTWFKKDIDNPIYYSAVFNNDDLTNLEVVHAILALLTHESKRNLNQPVGKESN